MRVDLYTDAGLKGQCATWAAVIVIGGVIVFEKSGRFREALDDTTTLELRAIANAIHEARRSGYLAGATSVHVHCDNSWSVGLLKGKAHRAKTKAAARHRETIDRITRIARGLSITFRGVAGHQKLTSPDPKAPFNRRADELCRIERRKHEKSK